MKLSAIFCNSKMLYSTFLPFIKISYLKVPNVTEKVLTNVFQLLGLRGGVFVQDSDSVEIIKVEASLV